MIASRLRRNRPPAGTVAALTLPASVATPARAREAVRDVLVGWDLEEFRDTAMLLTSELVTNAVRYAGTAIRISLERLHRGGVRIAVTDSARGDWPQVEKPTVDAEGGRGLWLVDRLASSWGTTAGRRGKSVWFELQPSAPDFDGD